MKLYKIIATMLCSILFLSACSTLTKEEYIDAVAKEQYDENGDIEKLDNKLNNKTLSVDEKIKHIEDYISNLKESQKISPPAEYKEAHEEYIKLKNLFIKMYEDKIEDLKNPSAENYLKRNHGKELDEYVQTHESFIEKLGEEGKKQFLEKGESINKKKDKK